MKQDVNQPFRQDLSGNRTTVFSSEMKTFMETKKENKKNMEDVQKVRGGENLI